MLNGSSILEIVVHTLQESQYVSDVVVIGLDSPPPKGNFMREVIFLPSAGGIVDNGLSALNWLLQNRPDNGPILFCSVDIPTITPEIVDEFVESCQPFESGIYYSVVTRETMERRFPGARRTYFHLKSLELAGGDMIVTNVTQAEELYSLLSRFENARKSPWKVALMVGPRKFVKFLIRQLSLDEAESAASKILGIKASVIVFPHAEVAMDIDKAQHLELIQSLSGRPSHRS